VKELAKACSRTGKSDDASFDAFPSQKVPSLSGLPVKSGTFTSILDDAIDAFL